MNDLLISFFVPIYNTERYLAECIDSILAQQGDFNIEIIMVDDASTDNSEQVARRYLGDPRVRYVRHEVNKGAAYTLDEGFRLARGRYVARIDSDDRYLPDFLQRTVPILEANPDIGLVYGDIRTIDPTGAVTSEHLVVAHAGKPWRGDELDTLLQSNPIPAPTVIGRSEAWQGALPIPAHYSFNDWYLSLAIARNWMMYYTGELLADYRVHPQNMHRAMINNHKGEEITMDILANYFAAPKRAHHDARFRRATYAGHYLVLADKYFGNGMYADARRCYLRAVANDMALLRRAAVLRRLLGTLMGRGVYESVKRVMKRLLGSERGQRFDKLHLGCGANVLPGWANIDMVKVPGVINWDLSRPLPLPPSSVQYVYSEHFIEHLTKAQGLALLEECLRVMQPGGVIRLSTPDLRELISHYLAGTLEEWKDFGWVPQSRCDLLNEGMREWGHQYVFDLDELRKLLTAAGFVEVTAMAWRESSHPSLQGLESRPFHRDLIVEAVKPAAGRGAA